MSEYIRHTWEDEEVITAKKLNNIEEGIAEAKKAAEGVHGHSANNVTAGTFAGKVNANATVAADLSVAQVRDILLGTAAVEDMAGKVPAGTLYFTYKEV